MSKRFIVRKAVNAHDGRVVTVDVEGFNTHKEAAEFSDIANEIFPELFFITEAE